MRPIWLVMTWLCFFGASATANEPEPLVQELLKAREACATELLSLGLIDEQESKARDDRIERCVTDKIGFNLHVLALVTLREMESSSEQVLFIDAVEEIRERMERFQNPYE